MIYAIPIFFFSYEWAPRIFMLFPMLLSKPILKKKFDKVISWGDYLNVFQGPVPLREFTF